MWPDDLEQWLAEYQGGYRMYIGEDHRATEQRLFGCAATRDYSHRIAREAAEVSRTIARRNLITYDDLFDKKQFSRWLLLTTWREALRLVLDREPVLTALATLATEQRRLLHWRYVVQLTDLEVAKVLMLQDRLRYDSAAARQLSHEAYNALCRQLAKTLHLSRPAAGVSSIFPVYPGY